MNFVKQNSLSPHGATCASATEGSFKRKISAKSLKRNRFGRDAGFDRQANGVGGSGACMVLWRGC